MKRLVSDHALVRWIERGLGIDLSPARKLAGRDAKDRAVLDAATELGLVKVKKERRRLKRKAWEAKRLGASGFTFHGLKFPIVEGTVVTAKRVHKSQSRTAKHVSGRPREAADWRQEVEELV